MTKSSVTTARTAKMSRSVVARDKAIATCDFQKITGAEKTGIVAFAATAMHPEQYRGAIAKAILSPGKPATYTFKEIAKSAKIAISEIRKVDLKYIANNFDFRVALVGFALSFDWDAQTVTLRRASVLAKAPKKPKAQLALPAPQKDMAT
jgi:hypothetical protein